MRLSDVMGMPFGQENCMVGFGLWDGGEGILAVSGCIGWVKINVEVLSLGKIALAREGGMIPAGHHEAG
jgi:hypothetical protein